MLPVTKASESAHRQRYEEEKAVQESWDQPGVRYKVERNGHVTTEILLKICTVLDCQVEDILEIVLDK